MSTAGEPRATFVDIDSNGLYAGRVTVDDVEIPRRALEPPAGVAYLLDPGSGSVPFQPGHGYHRVSVQVSPRVPAFTDSIRSVPELELSGPSAGDTLSRSSGLTIAWNDAGADPARISITVIGLGNQEGIIDNILQFDALDAPGKFTVPAASPRRIPTGPLQIVATRKRYQEGRTRNPRSGRSRKYAMSVSSRESARACLGE